MEIVCPECHTSYSVIPDKSNKLPRYCAFCKASLTAASSAVESSQGAPETGAFSEAVTFIPGHAPQDQKIQFEVGPYQVLGRIGKGGMGEVFLAYDTTCGRRIALKRIRSDLKSRAQLHDRFLREARITSQLTHPAIIPIYAIADEKELAYYTMPFVEGRTLRQIFAASRHQSQKSLKADHLSSIPALMRIFLSVCQAIAYAHSKGVVHRDIKPNNIIVGPYGEVLILDWGLAKLISQTEEAESGEGNGDEEPVSSREFTQVGKVVGTITYMSPERALGAPATFQTDVYSLGVILYQILTLRHPFYRYNLKEFRQNLSKEVLHDPAEVAPYREVPPLLSRIVTKCLAVSLQERYQTVDELIHDVESYLEGRSEWFEIASLNIQHKADWEFQENVLIAEHIAITRNTEASEWFSLMVSKLSFADNIKLETRLKIGEQGEGVGFLLSVPEAGEREHFNSGYCLWVASDLNKSTKLLRSTVEVVSAPELFLQRNVWYQVRIEKIENNIHFYLNDVLQFSYISHLPLTGKHIGVLSRDVDFEIEPIAVFVGSQSIKVSCLAVPDAFLAHGEYAVALSEYRRIGYTFPGTAEGREALFKAGITLLEEARDCSDIEESLQKSEEALEEFSKLHDTSGAPFEYLGKALVYQAMQEYEEEAKCFELAYRRYLQHPLLPVLHEHLIYRMHESSRMHRKATYYFILLAARYLPTSSTSLHTKKLFDSLKRHWEPLYFIEDEGHVTISEKIHRYNFAIQLAFWLAKPYVLEEIIDEVLKTEKPEPIVLGNALFALIELGAWNIAQTKLDAILKKGVNPPWIQDAILVHSRDLQSCKKAVVDSLPDTLDKSTLRMVLHLMDEAIKQRQTSIVHELYNQLDRFPLSNDIELQLDCKRIWAYLAEENWDAADELLHHYSLEQLTDESTPLHFLYGCWLYVTEGKEIAAIHFSSILEVPFPRSWSLFSQFINRKGAIRQRWHQQAFLWEKRQLYRQCALFYQCIGDIEKVRHYQLLESQEVAVD